MARDYPWNSPYAFSENMVIHAIELEGLESYLVNNSTDEYYYHPTAKEGDKINGYSFVGPSKTDVAQHFKENNQVSAFFGGDPSMQADSPPTPAEITAPSQHSSLGFDWSYLSNPDRSLGENLVYSTANSINFMVEYLKGHSVADGSMRNLDGTAITLDGGVLSYTEFMSIGLSKGIAGMNASVKSFLRKSGVKNVQSHMDAMVPGTESIEILEEGTKLYRYSLKGTTDAKHYFTTDIMALPDEVGKTILKNTNSEVIFEEFILKRPIEVLKSKVNLINDTGATQVFSVEIQGASKVKELPLNIQSRQ